MNIDRLNSQTLAAFFSRSSRLRNGIQLIVLTITALVAFGMSSPNTQAQTYTEQPLHSFNGGTDGLTPMSSLIAVNGILYGTTDSGGSSNDGTLFSFDPATNTETTLHAFTGITSDGSVPVAGLLNVNGTLYGTTSTGGTNGLGTIFSYHISTNVLTTLYSFSGTDGANPEASLINVNGVLYGTTYNGGASSDGTVFSYNPSTNTEAVLHSFTSKPDGANPQAELLLVNGLLYGTTYQGGIGGASGPGVGTVFSIDPTTHAENIIHLFILNNSNDGEFPKAGLTLVNGILYGTTYAGGSFGYGTVFSIDPTSNTETFVSGTGLTFFQPSGRLTYDPVSGKLFGTAAYHYGIAFSVDPVTFREETVYTFGPNSVSPQAGLLDINGTLYGTTAKDSDGHGQINNNGILFSLTPAPPVAYNDSGKTYYNTPLVTPAPGVLGNDDNDGNPMAASLVTNPTHGTLTFHSDGSFTYTPTAGYLGTDSFTYHDTNSIGTGNTATVTLTISQRTPIAGNDSGRTYYNTTLNIAAPGVLGNDSSGGSSIIAQLVTNPTHGTITFNSDGSFKYVPNSGFLGTDSFTYQAVNSIGASNIATCTLLVQARTPVANNDAGRLTHNTTATFAAPAVLGNDNPGTNTGVSAAIVTNPTHGTITFNSNGSFVYTPTTGFIGTDSFTYKDTNSVGTSNTATCTLTVQ